MSALKPDVFIPALNADVLTIIFEELLNSNDIPCHQPNCWDSFLSLRLLSKQLNDIVVRVGFRQISLGSGILECFKTYLQVCCQKTLEQPWYPHTPETVQAQLEVAEYTRTYTRHIWFDHECSNLDWSWVPDMLTSLQNLTHITWSYWGLSQGISESIQYEVLACPRFRARWPKLRISLEDFYNEEAVRFYPLFVNVVSSTDGLVRDKDAALVTRIKNMLLASPKMEVFDLILKKGDDVAVNWDIKEGEKLPPFKDLNLRNVDWVFSPVEAVGFWDWSKITHLTMTKVPIIPFLKTVTPEYLSGLRTFKTDC